MAKDKRAEPIPSAQEGDLSALLQEYREKAGYSITQMADALCLSEDTLEHLEDENFEALAVPPYVRGYLRNYAKIADEDPDELINIYESLRGADPKELQNHFRVAPNLNAKSHRRFSPVMIQLFFLALLLAIIAGIFMIPSVNKWIKSTWQNISSQSSTPAIDGAGNPVLTGTMPIPTPLPGNDNTSQSESVSKPATSESNNIPPKSENNAETNAAPTSELPSAAEQPKDKENEKELTQQPQKTESLETNAETPVPAGDTINIKLVFNKEVWMRIRDKNKKTVFEGQNTAGKEKTLSLKKPLTFRVGNAQGLSLFVDGKPVDLTPYIKGSIANFTLE